jgi:hypothetical protein
MAVPSSAQLRGDRIKYQKIIQYPLKRTICPRMPGACATISTKNLEEPVATSELHRGQI